MDQYAMFNDYVDNDGLDPRMWDSEDDYDWQDKLSYYYIEFLKFNNDIF
jgi:hypothetical protein